MTKVEFYIFCQEYEPNISYVNGKTLVIDIGGDGDSAIDFLEAIDKKFFVSFEEFNFKEYFHDEIEISKAILGFGIFNKLRKIKYQLTVDELYNYIISHRSNSYEKWI